MASTTEKHSTPSRRAGRPAATKAKKSAAKALAVKRAAVGAEEAGLLKYRDFRAYLRKAPLRDRVAIERTGVPYRVVLDLINETGLSSADFQRYVGIPKATFTKKVREKGQFAGTSGQSVVGLLELINRVEDMLAAERDNPDVEGFDVEKWVGEWIKKPQPALGGMAPAQLLDTPTGRESVMRVLGAIQSGAYQ